MVDNSAAKVAFWWVVTVVAFVGFAGMGVVGLRDAISMQQEGTDASNRAAEELSSKQAGSESSNVADEAGLA